MFTMAVPFWQSAAAGSGYPSLPFTITFDEIGTPASGTAIGSYYTTSNGVTPKSGTTPVFADHAWITLNTGSSIPGAASPNGGKFAWSTLSSGGTFGFQFAAALQSRKITYYKRHGSGWTNLTIKTSTGAQVNYVLTGGNNGAWELVTHDLAVLAVGDPSLATGYITEVYYTGGSNISVDAITVYST